VDQSFPGQAWISSSLALRGLDCFGAWSTISAVLVYAWPPILAADSSRPAALCRKEPLLSCTVAVLVPALGLGTAIGVPGRPPESPGSGRARRIRPSPERRMAAQAMAHKDHLRLDRLSVERVVEAAPASQSFPLNATESPQRDFPFPWLSQPWPWAAAERDGRPIDRPAGFGVKRPLATCDPMGRKEPLSLCWGPYGSVAG